MRSKDVYFYMIIARGRIKSLVLEKAHCIYVQHTESKIRAQIGETSVDMFQLRNISA